MIERNDMNKWVSVYYSFHAIVNGTRHGNSQSEKLMRSSRRGWGAKWKALERVGLKVQLAPLFPRVTPES